jgi:iron(III) transport system ATP-binding protein
MVGLSLNAVGVRLGRFQALEGLSLELEPGQIGCLLGASGSGKTTTLRAIAGFERLSEGEIRLGEQRVASPEEHLEPRLRGVGMVFQDHGLFSHLSVADNVGFGLRHGPKPLDAAARQRRVSEMLEWVGMADQARKKPHELSGGQAQRVALARALAPSPRLVLFDEPFSSLDAGLRERLAQDVRSILKASQTTALFVTHDQNEAFALADQVGVMAQGRLLQWASAYELYHRPRGLEVARFVGEGVLLPAHVDAQGQLDLGEDFGPQRPTVCEPLPHTGACQVLIRPDDVTHVDASPVQAEVISKSFRGAQFLYHLRLRSGREVSALVPSHHNHAVGEWIGIELSLDHVIAFSGRG